MTVSFKITKKNTIALLAVAVREGHVIKEIRFLDKGLGQGQLTNGNSQIKIIGQFLTRFKMYY